MISPSLFDCSKQLGTFLTYCLQIEISPVLHLEVLGVNKVMVQRPMVSKCMDLLELHMTFVLAS